MKENAEKISEDDKKKLEEAIENAKKDFASDDIDTVKKAQETLSNVSQEVFAKFYQNTGAGQDTGTNASDGADGVNPDDIK